MASYTHLELNQEIEALAGYYVPLKEERLPYNDREVLYVVGQAVVNASCCGFANTGYVLIPGYVKDWKGQTNEDGLPVSEVELVSDEEERNRIRQVIREKEKIPQIEFWQ